MTGLLAIGIDFEGYDEGYEALMSAAEGGHVLIMKALSRSGVDVNEAVLEHTPLVIAIMRGMSGSVIDCLLEEGAKVSAGDIVFD